jgi:hypothetical protein
MADHATALDERLNTLNIELSATAGGDPLP